MKTITKAQIKAIIFDCTDFEFHVTDWKKVVEEILKFLKET